MQIYLSLMSQKNPSSDSSSYDLSSPQGRMLYVRETTNAAFSSWTSPLQRQDPDTQEEKKQEMLSRIMGKLKSGKKLSAKELDFLRRTDPILYAHALRVQRMAEALKQQLSHAKSKQEANDMITSAIAGVSDKDPDKEYLLAAYNEVSKIFINHRLISVCLTLRKMPKKEKRTIRMLILPMMRTRMTIRMISCHGPRFRKLLMRLQRLNVRARLI